MSTVSRSQEIIEALDEIDSFRECNISYVLKRVNEKVAGHHTWQTVMDAAQSVFPKEYRQHTARCVRLGMAIANTE